MEPTTSALDALWGRLRAVHGNQIMRDRSDPARLVLHFAGNDAAVGVSIADASVPSFHVSYPALKVRRNRDRMISDEEVDHVLDEGVLWIVKKVVRYGYVPPELGE